MRKPKIGPSRYVSELERGYAALENKCKTQETVIERLSKNYYKLKKEHDKAAMHFWLSWYKIGEESDESLEDKGWYLIIIPECDHPVVAQYIDAYKGFKVVKSFENPITHRGLVKYCIHRDLVKYWADLPEPDLFNAVENTEEK